MFSVREANSKGKIVEVTGKLHNGSRRQYLSPHSWCNLTVGEDVFHTYAEAEVVARQNAAKRIASLEKTLAKMRQNPFATPDTGRK